MAHPRSIAAAVALLLAGAAYPLTAAAQTPAVSSSGAQSGSQEARIAVNNPLGPAPALSAFRLDFGGADHRIRRMMVMPDQTAFRAAFNDRGGEDRFTASATWWVVPGSTGGSVSGQVRGISEFEIPPGPPGTTLVLSGFDIHRAGGTDANVRTFAIQLDGASRRIRTVLLDDQGADFTALAESLAVGFAFAVIGGPMGGGLSGSLYGAVGPGALSEARISLDPNTRLRSYTVEIRYAWVPNRYLDAVREMSGDGRIRGATASPHVLTGFSFHFGNSDHYLGAVGVNLADATVISWQDSNQDDPIQWSVRYAPLRPDPPMRVLRPVRPLPLPPPQPAPRN
jgi:hypothetical protein